MASGCDHVDHVRTQLPYALFAAVVAVAVGYLPEALTDAPAWILLVIGAAVIIIWMRMVGRPVDTAESDRGNVAQER
jgi:Na+/H+ antiporter NhaC